MSERREIARDRRAAAMPAAGGGAGAAASSGSRRRCSCSSLPLRLLRPALALTMLSQMGIMIVFALSYNMLLGQTGLLSFGHAVYYGLGALRRRPRDERAIRHGLPLPVVAGAAGRRPRRAALRHRLRLGTTRARRHHLRDDLARPRRAGARRASLMLPRLLRRRGRHHHQPHARCLPVFGLTFGPQIQVYYLIAAWCLRLHRWRCTRSRARRSAACATRCATTPSAPSSSATTRSAVRFIAFVARRASSPASPAALRAINYEIVTAELRQRRHAPASCCSSPIIGGIGYFFGPVHRRDR